MYKSLQQSVTSGSTQSNFLENLVRGAHARVKVERLEKRARQLEKKKEEIAFTARANEICVVLTTQKYDRLMLIITIIIVVVVFVAPLTLSVGWAGVRGIYLDGLKKRSLV